MIVDGITKSNLDIAEVQRSSTSLKRIYNQLRQTYYQELFVRINDKEEIQEAKKKHRSHKSRKKMNKILPELVARQGLLTTR